jgi:hypothetical protein
MTRPLSNDLRKRVVAAVLGGESCRSVGSRFGVSMSSVVKWSQRYRRTGSVAPGQMGRTPQASARAASSLHSGTDRPGVAPDAARAEGRTRCAWGPCLAQCSVEVSAREGPRFKKTLFALEQARADIARGRRRWRSWQARLDPRHLVFIDETWIKTSMAPLRGWGPKGHRLRGFAPHGHWRTLTLPGRPALRPTHGALRLRRPDQRRMLPRLCHDGSATRQHGPETLASAVFAIRSPRIPSWANRNR